MNKPIYIYVDETNNNFPGFSIITRNILEYIPNSILITDFSKLAHTEIIIPIGVVASNNLILANRKCKISFLMDSPTLCFRSIILFYLRKGIFFKTDILLQLARLLKYHPIEKKIIKKYDEVIVVSTYDQKYLEKKYNCSNVTTISNGVDLPSKVVDSSIPFKPSIGFLYYWGVNNSLDDIDWFVHAYLPKLKKAFPNLEIIAAGKGATDRVKTYFKKFGIKYIGEVKDLNEFYSTINIYITTVRKECGILNKVLDAMAHKKIVVALKRNMHAFNNLKEGYYSYSNIEELILIIKEIETNPEKYNKLENNALEHIRTFHSWEKNYKEFYKLIANSYNLSY